MRRSGGEGGYQKPPPAIRELTCRGAR
jgi:hypothetical protein